MQTYRTTKKKRSIVSRQRKQSMLTTADRKSLYDYVDGFLSGDCGLLYFNATLYMHEYKIGHKSMNPTAYFKATAITLEHNSCELLRRLTGLFNFTYPGKITESSLKRHIGLVLLLNS